MWHTIFTEQNVGLLVLGLVVVAFAAFVTYKANEQERQSEAHKS